MSVIPNHDFAVYSFRLAQKATGLPFPITVMLPKIGNPIKLEDRKEDTLYAEDFFPQNPDHHTLLGQFVDRWGYLENIIIHLLKVVLVPDGPPLTATTVFQNIGIRKTVSLIQSLATMKLPDNEIKDLVNLFERLSSLNSKRNILVHGTWTVEIVWYVNKEEDIVFKGTLLREVPAADHRIRHLISDLRNQKERIKHTFNLKRIIAVTRDVQTLAKDIGQYRDRIAAILGPPLVDDPHNMLTDEQKGLI